MIRQLTVIIGICSGGTQRDHSPRKSGGGREDGGGRPRRAPKLGARPSQEAVSGLQTIQEEAM